MLVFTIHDRHYSGIPNKLLNPYHIWNRIRKVGTAIFTRFQIDSQAVSVATVGVERNFYFCVACWIYPLHSTGEMFLQNLSLCRKADSLVRCPRHSGLKVVFSRLLKANKVRMKRTTYFQFALVIERISTQSVTGKTAGVMDL